MWKTERHLPLCAKIFDLFFYCFNFPLPPSRDKHNTPKTLSHFRQKHFWRTKLHLFFEIAYRQKWYCVRRGSATFFLMQSLLKMKNNLPFIFVTVLLVNKRIIKYKLREVLAAFSNRIFLFLFTQTHEKFGNFSCACLSKKFFLNTQPKSPILVFSRIFFGQKTL